MSAHAVATARVTGQPAQTARQSNRDLGARQAPPDAVLQTRLLSLAEASPQATQLRALQVLANTHTGRAHAAQCQLGDTDTPPEPNATELPAQPNHTGLPTPLKTGIETLSGMSLDHVRVHYHSSQPAQLNALAYAQGADIHVAPGQEKHLPHEAWHVVQQAQGRVRPTRQLKGGMPVNDDRSLEREADVMGARAVSQGMSASAGVAAFSPHSASGMPGDAIAQCKSEIDVTGSLGKKDTPLTTLHGAFGKYFQKAGLPEAYRFHALGNVLPGTYNTKYKKAGTAKAEIDPASASKADGSNRNNNVIGPYGHFGVMERSIFGRTDIGNLYDGGHLVEHTLMEGQDADIEGNLAPQQNKHFNQGLMRGWESVPEKYMHIGKAFTYTVTVAYDQQTYQRTGKQLSDAGVLGSLATQLLVTDSSGQDTASLEAENITFERWVPSQWHTTVAKPSGTKQLPQLTLTKGAHWDAAHPSQQDAEKHVFDTQPSPHTGTLKRSKSGMLAGFIETAKVPTGNPGAVTVGEQNAFSAVMYQPIPEDVRDQPAYTNNPGAYGGSAPVALPSYTPNHDSLADTVDFAEMSEVLYTHSQPKLGASKKISKKKRKAKTTISSLDGIGKKHSPHYQILRNRYFRNAGQGGTFIKEVIDLRDARGSKLSKADLVPIIEALLKTGAFGTKSLKFRLLRLPYEKKLK